jgi:F0F1-type ATP synthase assembly protein I
MASVSHEPATYAPRLPQWAELLKIRELWASLAISMMWLAVLFDAVFGPTFVSTSSGGNSTTIPSAVFVALFAFLASSAVAKHAFRQGKQ